MNSLLEVVERQGSIIKMQTDIIDELFLLLMQHIDDADKLSVVSKINRAAKMLTSLDRDAVAK